jgi:hypothetical protein
MTDIQIESGALYANLDDRTIRTLLVPFGEEGNTNLGRFTVTAGALKLPRDPSVVTLNTDHNREEPVGRAVSLEEREDGIHATFQLADTDEADAALQAVNDGTRARLSVEAKGIVLRAGQAIAGSVFGAALVARGAFPSATLLASDVGELDDEDEPSIERGIDRAERLAADLAELQLAVNVLVERLATQTPEAPEAEEPETPNPLDESEESSVTSPVPGETLAAAAAPDKREVLHILEAARAGRADEHMLARLGGQFQTQNTLFAALNDVKYDAAGSPVPYNPAPQWIGELWSGLTYEQKFVSLFGHADLTSKKIAGFRWNVKPAGAAWTGNKTNVPSNTPTTSPFEATAELWAGGHDHAIEHRLFDSPGYFEAYYQAMLESYAAWVDAKVIAEVLAGASTIVADNPTGLTIGAGMSALIDGAAKVIDNNATPSFAVVSPDLYKAILKTPDNATLGYLSAALNLKDGQLDGFALRSSSALTAGSVLVGAREAATVYELPGTPVRVEAPDTIKGGIDTNVFGAAGLVIHKADALVKVTKFGA